MNIVPEARDMTTARCGAQIPLPAPRRYGCDATVRYKVTHGTIGHRFTQVGCRDAGVDGGARSDHKCRRMGVPLGAARRERYTCPGCGRALDPRALDEK